MDFQAALERLHDYETVIDTMNCGLVARDTSDNIVFVNQKLADWLDYEREELVGKHVYLLAPPELHEFMEEDLRASQEGDLRSRLFAMRRKDSTTLPVVSIPQRFMAADGAFDGIVP